MKKNYITPILDIYELKPANMIASSPLGSVNNEETTEGTRNSVSNLGRSFGFGGDEEE